MKTYTTTAAPSAIAQFPYRPPGPATERPRSFNASADAAMTDTVYRRVLWMLADVRVIEKATGAPISEQMPLTRQALKRHGLPDREIDSKVMGILEAATEREDSPYEMSRAAPRSLLSDMPDAGAIFRNWIVPCPTARLNAFVCEQLLKEFTFDELLSIPGFSLVDVDPDPDFYDDPEFAGFVENPYQAVRLDLDPWLSRQGFIVPLFAGYGYSLPPSWGKIAALRVFRRPNDEKPFILKSREVPLHG